MPILRVGRQVRAGGLPTSGEIVELDQPAGTQNGETTQQRPMIQVVWHDLEGLEAARKVAAQEASREMAFLLLGNPRFCDESYTAFTEVQRVIPVSRYEVSNAAQASISPEAFAEAKVVADAEGLNLVGVLHSHVVEAAEESSQACGLFYSSTDAEDHAQFLPSAWSIGGVLNVRVDGSVQTAVFARSFEGYFAPLEKLVAP